MAHPRIRRALRWLAIVLGTLCVLVALPFMLLLIPSARNAIVQRGVSYANNTQTDYKLKIARVDRLDPWGADVHGIAVRDAQGDLALDVGFVSVRLAPLALLGGELVIRNLAVAQVRGHIRSPSKPAEDKPEQKTSSEVFPVHVRALSIHDAAIDTQGFDPVARIEVRELEGAGEWSDKPWAYLSKAELRVDSTDRSLLRLATRASRWDAERGGQVLLEGTLVDAPLRISANILPLDDSKPWPSGRAELRVTSLQPEAWATLGVAEAEVRDPVTLHLAVASDGSLATADVRLAAGASQAHVHAQANAELATVALDASSPNLRAVSGILPELKVKGRIHARYAYTSQPADLGVRWESVAIDGSPLPNGRIAATIALPTIKLRELTLDALGNALQAHGVYNTELSQGSVELALNELQLSELPLEMEEPAHGRVDGRLAAGLSGGGELTASGELSLDDLRVATIHVGSTQLKLSVSGTTEQPQGVIELASSDLDLAGTLLQKLTIQAKGDSSDANATLTIRAREGWFVSELEAQGLSSDVIDVEGSGRGQVQARPISFALQGQRAQNPQRTALALQLFSESNRLIAHGAIDGEDRGHAQLDLILPKLEQWAQVLGVEGLGGGVKAQVVMDGPLERPDLSLDLQASAVQVPRSPKLYADVNATASLGRGELQGKANLWTERKDAGAVLDVKMRVPSRGGELDYERMSQQSTLKAHVPLAQLTTYAGPRYEGIGGMVTVDADVSGTLKDPKAEIILATAVSLPAHKDLPPETLRIALHMDSSAASMRLNASDLEGELLTLAGDVTWPNSDMRASLANIGPNSLPPFKLKAKVSPRRLDTMQGVVAFLTGIYDVTVPIRVSAEVGIEGIDGAVNGGARAKVLVHSDKLDPNCALGAHSDIDLSLDLKDNDIEANMLANTNEGGSVNAKVSTRLLIGKEAAPGHMLKEVEVQAHGRGIALSKLPGLCDLEAGTGAFNLSGQGLGTAPLKALLEVGLDGLKAPDGAPVSTQITAAVDQSGVHAQGELRANGKYAGKFEGRLPLIYDAKSAVPTFPMDKPVYARVDLKALPLGPFMSFGEGLGRPRGSASGTLSLGGTLEAPKPEAVIDFKDVSFSIAAIAQPFRDINGRVSLRGRTVRIQNLLARDRDGRVRINGEASLKEDGSGKGEIRVQAVEFPLRRQGEVVGELTTQIRMSAQMDTQQRVKAQVSVGGGRLWLTGDRGRSVQSLKEHDEIRFVDAPEEEAEIVTAETQVAVSLQSLTAKTEKSLWVMHKDFTVQVGLDIALEQGEAFKMKGSADIQRGNLQLLGKSFNIEKGSITFTGDFPPDPELELRAVYETQTGENLNVSVTGRASAPVLSFSGAATTAGEAVAVLSGSGRAGAESEAQADAANFAAGLTAGLLSVTIREEFGEWVPIISIENDESGAPARGRAGFDASKLIPEFLQGIARGAYVEGIVGSTDQSGGSVGLGARLEVSLPYDFVTSTGYGPGPTWGADLMWAP